MVQYCVGCGAKHDHYNWKYKEYEDREGRLERGWFCGRYFKPTIKEWISDRIKQDRNDHFEDIVQPWRDGEPSREYIDKYPHRAKKMFTDKERKRAKPVWSDIAPAKFKK